MKFDAIVIGSGQGGNPLAHNLSDKGWSVALIEEKWLGGTCINTGCTPTKTMVYRAQVAHYARDGAKWGIHTSGVKVNLKEIVAQKEKVVLSFRGGQEKQVKKRPNIKLFRGHARFTGPHSLSVGKETLESEKIFIDTGAMASLPPIAGLTDGLYLTNETAMELKQLPKHLIILGAGYIGLEFGQMFRRFGSKVTIVQTGGQIVPREDAEIAAEFQKALEAEGITFSLNTRATNIKYSGGAKNPAVTVTASVGRSSGGTGTKKITGSHLLVAAGRKPNTTDLGLEKAGVLCNERGFIKVNGKLETNVPGIWALGDVNGGPEFTHISYNDFQIIFGNLVDGKNLSTETRLVPYCVFTDPQLGGVGMTEKEARKRGYKLKIGRMQVSSVARAIERDETAGLMKLVVDASNDMILGASILAPEGGELVQILSTLMLAKQPYTLLKGAIYIHPTLAEGFFGLMASVKAE
jgi:pyruvate/2-oxoglutarate dehydrogenase complex dihydrolipoamide dehydrogenase (E3) component